jgi:hypothetical protein
MTGVLILDNKYFGKYRRQHPVRRIARGTN